MTGSARGIGQAIALRLAHYGVQVAAVDVSPPRETAERIEALGGLALPLAIDVTKPAEVERMVADTVSRLGEPDILVNNAGVAADTLFLEVAPDEFERIWRVNVAGVFHCSQAAARRMARRGCGRIVNIASSAGYRATWRRTSYGTSNAAVIQLTKQIAMELGPLGVTCNAVAPGPVDTDMAKAIQPPAMRKLIAAMSQLGRYGIVDEIAEGVAFLASDAAGYLKGHVLDIDGGLKIAGVKLDD